MVNIRKWKIEDAQRLSEIIDNKNIQNNLRDGIPYPYTKKDGEEYIDFSLNQHKENDFSFAITWDNYVVGSISVSRKDNIHRLVGELGYYIDENYWGKGIGTKAVKLISNYVFENSDIIRIFALPYSHNIASCKVLEKAGYNLEGILKNNSIKNGSIFDNSLYALLKL